MPIQETFPGETPISRRPSPSDDSAPFIETVHALLPRTWRVERSGVWTWVTPPGDAATPDQGWKLHLSAVPSSAPHVLERVTPLLVGEGCPFKFAASSAEVVRLTGRHTDRGSAGKFLTVYPPDGVDLAGLARALDEATSGLHGQRILSDRPLRPGGLVHFRYGAFTQRLRLAANGVYEPVIRAADGTWVPDRREAWFTPPAWAPPVPVAEQETTVPTTATQGVLIGERFLLRSAIRHANKGGVFRAVDTRTGDGVIVKQGRRYVEEVADGTDVSDLLHNEGCMLERLAVTGRVPRVHASIDLPEHKFLVVQAYEGVSLTVHLRRLHRNGAVSAQAIRRTALSLVDLVAAVHREGVVIRDLKPDNVMVLPDGELRLIDLELAVRAGQNALPGGSLGYAAPEQWTTAPASCTADLYSLGSILFCLATGAEPILADDDEREAGVRVANWLDRAARDLPLAGELAPLIRELLAPDPAARPSLIRVRKTLREPRHREPPRVGGDDDARRLLDDGLTFLVRSGGHGVPADSPPGTTHWWQIAAVGATSDPCNVYYGAAGTLAVLASACGLRPRTELLDATARAADWLERTAAREPVVLPGLHFGRAGTYWALLEAAIALGDDALASRTAHAAASLPASGAVPDVTYGIAGTGLAALRFWRHTREEAFLRLAHECADMSLERVVQRPDGVFWPIPPQPPHTPEAATHYGFAHGTAGVAAFLLDAFAVTGRSDVLDMAHSAGRALCAVSLRGRDGGVRWSSGPGHDVPLTGWCSGAAGVGSFLIRLWRATGENEFRIAAEGAAAAVRSDIWQSRPVHCHGTAGSMDFLLDMAEASGDERYRTWADEAVSALAARAVIREGLLLTPDHFGVSISPSWSVGVAGVAAALLRRQGTRALFMPPLDPRASLRPVPPPVRTASCRTDQSRPSERNSDDHDHQP
jgi:Lanthionine synthetase C-like protein/Protein kinase domain